ncbi:MAG: class I SAM-dependent methyltransferase [Spirochaetia bacterium]|nr:class I SAM-dependent methyltransferase [Spirochaetia bacterium]
MKSKSTENKGYFDQLSKDWDQNSMRHQIALNVARSIHKNVSLKKDSVMLDFGCGTGLVSFFFYPKLKRLDGVDTSIGMVEEFNKKAKKETFENAGARVFNMENEVLPVKEYDVIVSSMVFHHIKSPTQLLKKLHEALKPGGVLAIADLDEEDGTFHPAEAESVHHNGFSRKQISQWFAGAGYQSVALETVMNFNREGHEYSIFLCRGSK